MILNEYQHQALINLILLKEIDILESLGHDAIPAGSSAKSNVIYAVNLEILEKKISQAIIDCDEMALGKIMMKLFMNYNICTINEKAQELKDEAKQEQDDLHGVLGDKKVND